MPQAAKGDKVRVHYTGRLDDETVFDSSLDREPLEFTLGAGQVIPGFEDAVIGMEPGDSQTTRIPPERAYGTRAEELEIHVESGALPDGLEVSYGDQLRMRTRDGREVPVTVVDVRDDGIVVDANHPLSGKALTFEIELLEIV